MLEIGAVSMKGTSMSACAQTLDDHAGGKFKVIDGRDDGRGEHSHSRYGLGTYGRTAASNVPIT